MKDHEETVQLKNVLEQTVQLKNVLEQTVPLKNVLEQTVQYPQHTSPVEKNRKTKILIFLVFQVRKKLQVLGITVETLHPLVIRNNYSVISMRALMMKWVEEEEVVG